MWRSTFPGETAASGDPAAANAALLDFLERACRSTARCSACGVDTITRPDGSVVDCLDRGRSAAAAPGLRPAGSCLRPCILPDVELPLP